MLNCEKHLLSGFICLLFTIISSSFLYGQEYALDTAEIIPFEFDKLTIPLVIDEENSFEIEFLYTSTGLVYVNTELLFKSFQLSCEVSKSGDSISGFLENESQRYLIDYKNKTLQLNKKSFTLKTAIVKDFGFLYVESNFLRDAFGIEVIFNIRTQEIIIKSLFEFPLTKLISLAKNHRKLNKKQHEIVYDSIIGRKYHVLKFGVFDWSVHSSQTNQGLVSNQFAGTLGCELLFGQTMISAPVANHSTFKTNPLRYSWVWIDNQNPIVKQIQIGNTVAPTSFSLLPPPIIGINLKNTTNFVRKAKGVYYLKETTNPNWNVELYINNQLADFTTADGTGFFLFKIPIVYGYTEIKLKFYGPFGEVRTEERTFNLPHTFVPAKDLDYTMYAGILQDSLHSQLMKPELSYGLTTNLTISGGCEYLSNTKESLFTPYAKMAFQPFNKLTLGGEYILNFKTTGFMNCVFRKRSEVQLSFLKYTHGRELANDKTIKNELTFRLTMPLKINKMSGYFRADNTIVNYRDYRSTNSTLICAMSYQTFSFNATTTMNKMADRVLNLASEIALSYRNKKGYTFIPGVRYDFITKTTTRGYFSLEKILKQGSASLQVEHQFETSQNAITLTFRYNLNFMRTTSTVKFQNDQFFISEGINGSLLFNNNVLPMKMNLNNGNGKGGLEICTFLDLNTNNHYDVGEPKVEVKHAKTPGGIVSYNSKDTLLMISDLNAFMYTDLEFSDKELASISWRFYMKKYNVLIDPNQYKRVDVPITVVGEINGNVMIDEGNQKKGVGKILLTIYAKNSDVVLAEIYSEEDGYFEYLGLKPGDYTVRMDEKQLKRIKYNAGVIKIPFTIKPLADGDAVHHINFLLSKHQ